jgi:ribosomal protein L29
MKAAELRQKDVAGLASRSQRSAKGPFRLAHAKGYATTQQHRHDCALRAASIARAKTILAEKQALKTEIRSDT